MKIPKYIDYALKQRTAAADKFNHYDHVVSTWLEKQGFIETDIPSEDWFGGVESIVNPSTSENTIRKAVESK